MMDILINTYDTMAKILLVEDEVNIASFIERGLREFGHEVYVAYDGAAGWELTQKNDFQLLILDIIMPKMNGLQLCKQYRQRFGYHAPVIMLTALGTTEDIVSGLDAGADDYLVKPFDIQEVLLRIRVLLRRNQPQEETLTSNEILEAGEIEILPDTLETIILNKRMKLTPTEFEILYCLLQHFNKPVTLATLLEEVWGYSSDEDVRMLRVHVGALRNKIEPDAKNPKYLHTVTNVGYKLTPFGG